ADLARSDVGADRAATRAGHEQRRDERTRLLHDRQRTRGTGERLRADLLRERPELQCDHRAERDGHQRGRQDRDAGEEPALLNPLAPLERPARDGDEHLPREGRQPADLAERGGTRDGPHPCGHATSCVGRPAPYTFSAWVAVAPPSATNSAPVLYELSSLARNATRPAISSGLPTLPSATFAPTGDRSVSSPVNWRIIAVSIMPGCTEFARIPFAPSSSAATFVMPRMANFVAV